MKLLLLLFTFISTSILQTQAQLPATHIKAGAGPATLYHNGVLPGINFSTTFLQYFTKKVSWTAGLGGTINDKVVPVFYKDPVSGQPVDGSIRQTVGGMQLSGEIGYSFVRNSRHELQARLGAVGRYQSSSQLKSYSILFITPSGYPGYTIINEPKQRTLSLGANLVLAYNYTIVKNITIGLEAALQQHSNGDEVSRLGIMIGKRF